jgi:endonuclease-8
MPEGDTIHRTAAALRAAVLGQPMTAFEAPRLVGPRPSVGSVIERVESKGKHLEVGWDDGIVLHTHMRMSGSWHLYHEGERWRKPQKAMRVIIEVPGWQAVCFSAPVVETYRAKDYRRHPGVGGLGPDLCKADADLAECVRRMGLCADAETTMDEVLLDQRVACGVGNVYKSEVLWAVGVHPFTPLGAVPIEVRAQLIETAARLLRANLRTSRRITTARGGLAVYGRFGKPCSRCATPIEVRRHGEQARVTYWCPGCQVMLTPAGEAADYDDAAAVAADDESPLGEVGEYDDTPVPSVLIDWQDGWLVDDEPGVERNTAPYEQRDDQWSDDRWAVEEPRLAAGPEPREEPRNEPVLDPHVAADRLISYRPRGPEPPFVDPLLARRARA